MTVSIVMPVYNTKRDVFSRMLDSVLAQTETDFELIVVDDGSNEEYAHWLDMCQDRDSRIRVSHYPNGGNHLARYRGISEAKGEWIYICDADDYLHPCLLEYCLWAVRRHQADLIMFRFNRCRGNNVSQTDDLGNFENIDARIVDNRKSSVDELIAALPLVHIDNWAQFMRAEQAKALPPVTGTSDLTRTFRLIKAARRWVASRGRLYYYNYGESDGITMSPLRIERVRDSREDWERLIGLYSVNGRPDPKDPVWRAVCRGFLLVNLKIVYNWIRRRQLRAPKDVYLREFAVCLKMLFREYGISMRWCKFKQRLAYWYIMWRY